MDKRLCENCGAEIGPSGRLCSTCLELELEDEKRAREAELPEPSAFPQTGSRDL